ncbi:MAG: FtsQ-type POTRA domain-containing protein [Propionibacteriaceae bacterium]|jgi:cell division protein FtsQ|nr:FtsQ-type POTRA domain-containing protein [Propionibacteriaceae bacterium]
MTGYDGGRRDSTVTDTTAVIASRVKASRKRVALRVGVVVGLVAVAAVLVWLVWFSPAFVARSLEVRGVSQVSPEEITVAADVVLGTPLIRLDTAAIAERVEGLPAVADVAVSRQLSGVVDIQVTERQPVYAVLVGDAFLLVDGAGVGYLTVPQLPSGLPTVGLPSTDESDSAKRLMADASTVVQALPVSVRAQMTTVAATTPDDFTVTLSSGAQIMWGSAEQCELKASVIDALLKTAASYYDVSSPTHPATRP